MLEDTGVGIRIMVRVRVLGKDRGNGRGKGRVGAQTGARQGQGQGQGQGHGQGRAGAGMSVHRTDYAGTVGTQTAIAPPVSPLRTLAFADGLGFPPYLSKSSSGLYAVCIRTWYGLSGARAGLAVAVTSTLTCRICACVWVSQRRQTKSIFFIVLVSLVDCAAPAGVDRPTNMSVSLDLLWNITVLFGPRNSKRAGWKLPISLFPLL